MRPSLKNHLWFVGKISLAVGAATGVPPTLLNALRAGAGPLDYLHDLSLGTSVATCILGLPHAMFGLLFIHCAFAPSKPRFRAWSILVAAALSFLDVFLMFKGLGDDRWVLPYLIVPSLGVLFYFQRLAVRTIYSPSPKKVSPRLRAFAILVVVAGFFIYLKIHYWRSDPYEMASPEESANFKTVAPPLPKGTRFKISQGAFGRHTHNLPGLEYAWDFDVPYGTPVLAVEEGKVIQVWEPNMGGGCDKKFSDLAHNIKILDGDGMVEQYVHVQSRVRLGDKVERGQVIAVTGNNGFHCTPQLHFNIFKDRNHLPENGKPETIPVLFISLPDHGTAHEGYEGTVDWQVPRP